MDKETDQVNLQQPGSKEEPKEQPVVEPKKEPELKSPEVVETKKEEPKETKVPSAKAPSIEVTDGVAKKQREEQVSALARMVAEKGSPGQRAIMTELEKYRTHMARGISHGFNSSGVHTGALRQYSLWQTLKNVINNYDQEEFRRTWTTLLHFVADNRDGVFSDRLAMRFSEFWSQDTDELQRFQRVMNLILISSDPHESKNLKSVVSLDKTLEGFPEVGRRRVLEYYNQ